ncbi:MAG: hypothetical protein J6D53_03340, partial [Blautia sp.]|nr:hypothetical protein [Blautia sp.]
MAKRSNKPFFKKLGTIFFAVIIVVFLINLVLPDRSFSDKENRVLSSFPAPNLVQMASGRQEPKYETYVNDQFFLRDFWITLKAGADRLMGKVENNGVWLCKDGYLMENFTAPTPERLEANISSIEAFADRHADINTAMIIVPNAVNIMSSRLPAGALTENQNSYLDEVKNSVKEHGISFIDLRETLSNHSLERIYYKTDHHWTTLGAYYGYLASADQLDLDTSILTYDQLPVSDSFQGTLSAKSGFRSGEKEEMYVFLPRNDTAPDYVVNYVDDRTRVASFYQTDRLETRDKYAMFLNGNHAQVKINTPTADDRTLLIFKDSYANCFVPFLGPHYRNIILIDPRYYYGNVEELIAAKGVDEILYLYNANTFFLDTSLELTLAAGEGSDITDAAVSTPAENTDAADITATGTSTSETTAEDTPAETTEGSTGTEGTEATEGGTESYDSSSDDTGYDESYDYDYDSSYDESYDE